MAHFTSLVENIALRLELPSPQLVSQWKSCFPMQWWCNVLSLVISQGPFHVGGGERRHAYCLPFRNHHFSRIDSTSHSMAGRVHCLWWWGGVGGGEGCVCGQLHQDKSEQHSQSRWMITCCVRHSAPHSHSEMQFLRRTGGWMPSPCGVCRHHTDEVCELVQVLHVLSSQTCTGMDQNLRLVHLADVVPHLFDCIVCGGLK